MEQLTGRFLFASREEVEVEDQTDRFVIYRYVKVLDSTGHQVGDLRVLPRVDFVHRIYG